MAYSYYTTYDMNICIVRPFNVFGPGQKDGKCGAVIPIWTTSLLEGNDITIYGEGTQSREFIFIDDLVSAYRIIIDKMLSGKELAGEVINVGTGVDVKVNYLDIKDIRNYKVSTSNIEDVLGFKSKYTPKDSVNEILSNINLSNYDFTKKEYYNINTFKEVI